MATLAASVPQHPPLASWQVRQVWEAGEQAGRRWHGDAWRVVHDLGIEVQRVDATTMRRLTQQTDVANGCCKSPVGGDMRTARISLLAGRSAADETRTLIHELGHVFNPNGAECLAEMWARGFLSQQPAPEAKEGASVNTRHDDDDEDLTLLNRAGELRLRARKAGLPEQRPWSYWLEQARRAPAVRTQAVEWRRQPTPAAADTDYRKRRLRARSRIW